MTERKASPKCWAYDDQGRICGKPATGIHYQGGYTVCQEHSNMPIFGPQPVPENPYIFNRPSNHRPIIEFFSREGR